MAKAAAPKILLATRVLHFSAAGAAARAELSPRLLCPRIEPKSTQRQPSYKVDLGWLLDPVQSKYPSSNRQELPATEAFGEKSRYFLLKRRLEPPFFYWSFPRERKTCITLRMQGAVAPMQTPATQLPNPCRYTCIVVAIRLLRQQCHRIHTRVLYGPLYSR